MRARAAVAVIALALLLVGCSPRDAIDAAGFLADLRAGGPAIARTPVTWIADGARSEGDVYRPPDGGSRAAIVLVPGLAPEGRDDPRLTSLARSLAAARFTVLVPEIAGLRAQQVSVADARAIAGALRHMLGQPEGAQAVGLFAVSYAVGPAMLAALEPDLGGRIAFLAAIGGYHDLPAVVTFFTTGRFKAAGDSAWRAATPNEYGKWVFVLANADRVAQPADRIALQAMARRKLADLAAPVADLERGLGPEGQAVVALLNNHDPDRVPALIEALPAAIRSDLRALDLARRDLTRVQARAILIHGRDDAIIPWPQSQALAAALPPGRAHLAVVDGFGHADAGVGDWIDAWRLWRAATVLMGERR